MKLHASLYTSTVPPSPGFCSFFFSPLRPRYVTLSWSSQGPHFPRYDHYYAAPAIHTVIVTSRSNIRRENEDTSQNQINNLIYTWREDRTPQKLYCFPYSVLLYFSVSKTWDWAAHWSFYLPSALANSFVSCFLFFSFFYSFRSCGQELKWFVCASPGIYFSVTKYFTCSQWVSDFCFGFLYRSSETWLVHKNKHIWYIYSPRLSL